MKNLLGNKKFRLAMALFVAFALGFIARALDIRIDLKKIFAETVPWSQDARGECVTIEGEEICYGKATYEFGQHDRKMYKQLKSAGLPDDPPLTPGYPKLLADALGVNTIVPATGDTGGPVRLGAESAYEGGKLREISLPYRNLPVANRALYARHQQSATKAIIVLHGLVSSADKVMGREKIDYLRAIGKKYFHRGYDVIALDLTTDPTVGSDLSSRIMFYGTTTHGIAVRAVCDLRDYLKKQDQYRRIFLYGLSNGGTVAYYAATLCGRFDAVIADHGSPNWRNSLWNKTSKIYSNMKYPMFVLYRRAFFRAVSPNAFFAYSASPLFVVLHKREFGEIRDGLTRDFDIDDQVSPAARVNFIYKTTRYHMPEIEAVIDKILTGDIATMAGAALTPRRDFSAPITAAPPENPQP